MKSKVMTAADGLSARQGYSHRGCGSASRDSRKSKERWWDGLEEREQRYLVLGTAVGELLWSYQMLKVAVWEVGGGFTWTMSSMGVTSKPSHVPHGARILHRS